MEKVEEAALTTQLRSETRTMAETICIRYNEDDVRIGVGEGRRGVAGEGIVGMFTCLCKVVGLNTFHLTFTSRQPPR